MAAESGLRALLEPFSDSFRSRVLGSCLFSRLGPCAPPATAPTPPPWPGTPKGSPATRPCPGRRRSSPPPPADLRRLGGTSESALRSIDGLLPARADSGTGQHLPPVYALPEDLAQPLPLRRPQPRLG